MKPIITVDLEDWFHLLECEATCDVSRWLTFESRIQANTERLLALFAEQGVRATFFVLGWVARNHPDLLRKITAQGHEIGCHSDLHALVHRQAPFEFRDETARALGDIQDAIQLPVRLYRAPGFSITKDCLWAFEILAELGIEGDASVFPGTHAHGGLQLRFPRCPFLLETATGMLREFPVSVARLGPMDVAFAGGGFFRLLPQVLISGLMRRQEYVMAYFHPRDFDPGQPRIRPLPLLRTFKAYVGLNGSLAKLRDILGTYGGQSLTEASRSMDWMRAPRLKVS